MQSAQKSDMITVTPDGVIICPNCGKVIRGVRIRAETEARGLLVFCRYCKTEYKVNIEGQRLKGQRQ
mgnify:CR=1 FL=1